MMNQNEESNQPMSLNVSSEVTDEVEENCVVEDVKDVVLEMVDCVSQSSVAVDTTVTPRVRI